MRLDLTLRKFQSARPRPRAGLDASTAPHSNGSGFISSIPKSSTATSGSIKVDLAFGAVTDVENGRLDSRLSSTAIGLGNGHDL